MAGLGRQKTENNPESGEKKLLMGMAIVYVVGLRVKKPFFNLMFICVNLPGGVKYRNHVLLHPDMG